MDITLNPYIELIKHRQRKGTDKIPLKGELLVINFIGPDNKNLLIPKEEANRLRRKVISGKAELKSG